MSSGFAPDGAERCPHCDMAYRRFRTGYTYKDVFELLKIDDDPDPATWSHKGRKRVLWVWCGLKQDLWAYHRERGGCDRDPRNVAALADREAVPF